MPILQAFERTIKKSVELKSLLQGETKLHNPNMNRKIAFSFTTAFAIFVCMASGLSRGQMPLNSAGAAARGDDAMNFDQAKTTRHFKLLPDGGAIEITANDPSDTASQDAIRQQIPKIATMFGQGNFNIPWLIPDQKPPCVGTMEQLKSRISYTAKNVPNGGRLRITTADPEGVKAVHDFLRFQIQEHKTGDSLADPVAAKRKHPANNLGHDARPAQP